MFTYGLKLDAVSEAYCGWRAILKGGYVDIVSNRATARGPEEDTDALVDWVNKSGAWKRMKEWAKEQWGWSNEVFEETGEINGRKVVLRASPQASHGYLYIGLGMLKEVEKEEVESA